MGENEILNTLFSFISIKTFIKIIILYIIIVWIALIVWVIKDINSRTNSILLQIFSILIVIIFGLFGALIYLLIRPTKTIYEKYYTEVEGNIDYLTDKIFKKLEKKEKEKTTIKKKKKRKKEN